MDVHVEVAPADLRAPLDQSRMHQVMVNLFDNASRYTGDEGRIDVRALRVGGRLRIEVADNGPGIPPDERARVFERFYRADHARTAHTGGSGLGLAIVRWIVDLHGGTVTATANEPHGCRMVIDLPEPQAAGW
jgi:signal transduction histidine kinase